MATSQGYKQAANVDHIALNTIIPDDGSRYSRSSGAYQRYLNSKQAVLYSALELEKRLYVQGCNTIFVNACHPGKSILLRMI
jgi:hypothetical protein